MTYAKSFTEDAVRPSDEISVKKAMELDRNFGDTTVLKCVARASAGKSWRRWRCKPAE